jgi:hypothetical protein
VKPAAVGTSFSSVGLKNLRAVTMKGTVFWDMASCSPVPTFRRKVQPRSSGFEGMLRNEKEACSKLSLPIVDLECGSSSFLRNVGEFQPDDKASHPGR